VRLVFTPRGWKHYVWWQANDRATLTRINRLVDLVDGEDLIVLQARYHYEA
jgi:toxin YoeB